MVWIKTLEKNYVNADNILSLTYDSKCRYIVAVVGYKETRLQHNICDPANLDSIFSGCAPRDPHDLIETIIGKIESAKKDGTALLDFTKDV